MKPDFSKFSDRVLNILERSLKNRAITRQDLSSWGLEDDAEAIFEELKDLNSDQWLPAIRAALNERKAFQKPRIDITWTGFSDSKQPRDSAIVLAELFEKAQFHILLTAYSWDSKELLEALKKAALRGVEIELYLDIKQDHGMKVPREEVDRQIDSFLRFWETLAGSNPFTGKLFFDERVLLGHEYLSMHAKCAIIDQKILYVGSANLTNRGHTRNIEAGLVVEDLTAARAMFSVFKAGPFRRWELTLGQPKSKHGV